MISILIAAILIARLKPDRRAESEIVPLLSGTLCPHACPEDLNRLPFNF
jgi:hypothetical protein